MEGLQVYIGWSRRASLGKGQWSKTGRRGGSEPGRWGRNGTCKGPKVGVCRGGGGETSKVGRTSKGGGEEKAERQQGMECTPQMAEITPPHREGGSTFSTALSDAVVDEPARAGVRAAEPSTLEEPQRGLRAADICSACGSFLWLPHRRLPPGLLFLLLFGVLCRAPLCRYWGPLGLAPLGVCFTQSKGEETLKYSRCLWGHLLSSK